MKRDRLQILHDVLSAIQEKGPEAKPTHVLYKANLSHKVLTEYMEEVLSQNLAQEKEVDGKKTYSLTEKGFKFLQDFQVVQNFLESYGL